MPLVVFAGPKLLKLNIEELIMGDNVRLVLSACPNLLELTLRKDERSLDVLIETFKSGRCKIGVVRLVDLQNDGGNPTCELCPCSPGSSVSCFHDAAKPASE